MKKRLASPVQITSITAAVGGPCTFTLKSGEDQRLAVSSSFLIQRTLLSALALGSQVELEFVGGSIVIKRVLPFEAKGNPAQVEPGGYRVSRIATQRAGDGVEHLEVFLQRGRDPEKAYNVFDPSLQELLRAAFSGRQTLLSLKVEFEADEIASAELGWI